MSFESISERFAPVQMPDNICSCAKGALVTKPGKAVTVVTMDGKYLKSYCSLILYILLHFWLLKLLLKLFLFVFLKDDMISACRTCVVKCAKPRGLLEWMI